MFQIPRKLTSEGTTYELEAMTYMFKSRDVQITVAQFQIGSNAGKFQPICVIYQGGILTPTCTCAKCVDQKRDTYDTFLAAVNAAEHVLAKHIAMNRTGVKCDA